MVCWGAVFCRTNLQLVCNVFHLLKEMLIQFSIFSFPVTRCAELVSVGWVYTRANEASLFFECYEILEKPGNTSWFTLILCLYIDSWFECSIDKYLLQIEEATEISNPKYFFLVFFFVFFWVGLMVGQWCSSAFSSSFSSSFCLCPSSPREGIWLVSWAIMFLLFKSGIIRLYYNYKNNLK